MSDLPITDGYSESSEAVNSVSEKQKVARKSLREDGKYFRLTQYDEREVKRLVFAFNSVSADCMKEPMYRGFISTLPHDTENVYLIMLGSDADAKLFTVKYCYSTITGAFEKCTRLSARCMYTGKTVSDRFGTSLINLVDGMCDIADKYGIVFSSIYFDLDEYIVSSSEYLSVRLIPSSVESGNYDIFVSKHSSAYKYLHALSAAKKMVGRLADF